MSDPIPASSDQLPATAEPFLIDNDEKADWFLKQLLEFDKQIAGIEASYNVEISRLAGLRDARVSEFRAMKRQLCRMLAGNFELYMRKRIEAGSRRTLRLFHGSVSLRTVPRSVRVADESAATLWAKQNLPDAVKSVLVKSEYLKWFKSTGELLPGLETTPEHEKFAYDGQEQNLEEDADTTQEAAVDAL